MQTPSWNDARQRWQLDAYKDGKKKTFTSSKKSDKRGPPECRKKAQAWIDGSGEKSTWLFSRCWAAYLEDVKARTSEANSSLVEKYGRLYILPRLGTYKMRRISDQDWQDCITKADPVNGKPLSKKYLGNIRGAIAGFWRFAKKSRMIDAVPDPLVIPKSAPVIGKQIMERPQVKQLMSADYWYANAHRLEIVTGLRPGEIYGLQKADIRNGHIHIKRAINTNNQITSGKENSARKMPLTQAASSIIMDQLIKISQLDTEWLFPQPDGSQPRHRTGYQQYHRWAKVNGIQASPYGLRHTFVSNNKTVPLATMKRMLGHTEDMDTYGVYDHEVDQEYKDAAKAIDANVKRLIE